MSVGSVGRALTYSNAIPEDLGVPSAGVLSTAARGDHVHKMPTAAQIGALTAAALEAFRDANRVYVSPSGSDTANGTSLYEPLRTLGAAALAAQPGDLVVVGPGVYTETALPIRWKRNVGLLCAGLRNTTIKPAAGQELNGFFRVDSGFWVWGLEFAGHQANSATGDLSWAISFNELADNRDIGAVGLGAFVLKSPYIQNCSSITAEDDSGTAGSVSTGDTGGGIKVDGAACAANSPIRSMVVDSYTQVNLGGPGCLVLNDGYAQLVSFFGTFCEYHVKSLTGGQVNLSGGGTSDFGVYGLVANGYSSKPVFTGASRIANYGAARVDKAVTVNEATNTLTCISHGLVANDQVTFSVSQGALPTPLASGTTYYVRAAGLTADTFSVAATAGGAILDITGTTTGTYTVIRQGVTEIDVIGFSANRLGRQLKYPSAGTLGAAGSPVVISSVSGSTLTVTLSPSIVRHEYVGGGTLTVSGVSYDVTAASYNNSTGVTTIKASGYTPAQGASITLSGLSFICDSSSRPSAGQLMFPQLVFPRNATTGAAQAKTFTYSRATSNTFTYPEAASPSGPDHEYVSGGTVTIGGTDYGVAGAVYDKVTGQVTITTVTTLPNDSTGSVIVSGLQFICPTSAYIVSSSVPINASGVSVANDSPSRAGYRVLFFSGSNGGLRDALAAGQLLDFRQRSQISAPSHTFEYVGSGTNYSALPWNGGVPIPANKIVEINNGKVYSSNTDELGNFAIGSQFSVDGTSGAVTINTSQFNLTGLNFIGPFSRNGGISPVGEQLREISNNTSLFASTGAPDGNTAPTQFAVKTYVDNKFLQAITATVGQPITVSDTSTVDAQGFSTLSRNISLSLNAANGLLQLNSSGLVPASFLPSYVDDVLEFATLSAFPATGETSKIYVDLSNNKTYRWSGTVYVEISPSPGTTDALSEGTTNLYFTQTRARGSISVSGSLNYVPSTGVLSYTAPTLGTAAPLDVAATGNASATQVVRGSDSRLSDARTPTTHSQGWTTITGTPTTLVGYGITDGFTESRVRGTPLTGFTSSSGTIAETDSVLTAIQKLSGNLGAAGTGSVTFVGLSLPTSLFNVTTATVTTSGTLTAALSTQSANLVLAGPASGAAAAPTFRALVSADLPLLAGYTSAAGTVATSDSIVSAIGKLNGNVATKASTGAITSSGLTVTSQRVIGRSSASTGALEEFALLGLAFNSTNLATLADLVIPLSDETTGQTASTITPKLTTPYWPRATVLTDLPIWAVATVPTGASGLQFDIKVGGTSIFTTLPTIAISATSSVASGGAFSTAFISSGNAIALGAKVEFFVTQAGGGGAGLKVVLPTRRAG